MDAIFDLINVKVKALKIKTDGERGKKINGKGKGLVVTTNYFVLLFMDKMIVIRLGNNRGSMSNCIFIR